MKTMVHLYGIEPEVFSTRAKASGYIDVLEWKVELGNKLLKKLYDIDYMNRDINRIGEVDKAISFNEKLIKEVVR